MGICIVLTGPSYPLATFFNNLPVRLGNERVSVISLCADDSARETVRHMSVLVNKKILLGVSGGIAAYKAAELLRRLREAGAEVRVVMTRAATQFVGPMTFQALSGHPVRTELMDPSAEAAMGHIELARWADLVLVAPATADCLAKLAHGLADDLLSTLCLATEAPLMVAPAMNRIMWGHPATRANTRLLAERGVLIAGPAAGEQACGERGLGRMLEPAALVEQAATVFSPGLLAGVRVLMTAGPTREAIDPVRFIGNRSSGKMGFAIAEAAAAAGAHVVLVCGPVSLPTPPGVERIDVDSAQAMHEAVMARVADCDLFIAAAAVADYRPKAVATEKIKKSQAELSLELVRNPDIVADVAALPDRPFTVGFAAETTQVLDYARDKLQRKGLDMIAANEVGESLGFESDDNALYLLWPDGEEDLGRATKRALAHRLLEAVARRFQQARPALRQR